MRIISAEFVKSVANVQQLPEADLPEIAIAGRSNVGKSSLINALCNKRSLAITGKTPGRTRLLNFFEIKIANDAERFSAHIVDLPGYGFAKVPKAEQMAWKKLVESYLLKSHKLVGLVVLIDSRRGIQEDDSILLSGQFNIPIIPVLTKVDKLSKTELANVRNATARALGMEAADVFCTGLIGKKKTGVEDLCNSICHLLE